MLLPFLLCLIELVAANQSNNEVDFHYLSLLSSKVLVSLKLVRDSLGELVPVEISNQLLEVLSVDLIVATLLLDQSAHVYFN